VTSLGPSNPQFVGISFAALREYLRMWLNGEARTAGELSARHRPTQPPDHAMGYFLLDDPQLPIVPSTPGAHRTGRETLDEIGAAADFVLASAVPRPNPTRDRVTIDVELAALDLVQPLHVAVFDLAGRRVRTLMGCVVDGNRLAASWDLRDEGGRRVGQGVYFVSIRPGDAKRVARLLVVP
jgi:hypothetical protein